MKRSSACDIRHRARRLLAPSSTSDRGTILWSSAFVVATTIATSALGFAYWWLAARRFSPHEVGLAATAVSAMTLLALIGMLGLGTILISEVHGRAERALAYVTTGMLLSLGAGIFIGALAVFGGTFVSEDLATFGRDTVGALLFPAGVGLSSAGFVADQALIGLLRSGTQFVRNGVFAAAKLAILGLVAILPASGEGHIAIFGTWVAGLIISLLVVGLIALRAEPRLSRYRPDMEILRHLGGRMVPHHTLNLAFQAPSLALTVIVTTVLGATAAGYFYVAFMISGFISIAGPALGIALFAVGARSPERLAHSMRLTLAVSFVVTAAGVLIVLIAARWLLGVFGANYADEGTTALIVLSLATLPGIIKSHFVQVQRVSSRIGRAAVIAIVGATFELVAATVGAARGGLSGLTEGFAAAILIEGVLMAPSVLRAAGLWGRQLAGTAAPPDPAESGGD
jgi:O-antigen/teichoic acid export membrane protein